MAEWMDMGGYGFFVWSSYGTFVGIMIYLLATSLIRGRNARKLVLQHAARNQANEVEK